MKTMIKLVLIGVFGLCISSCQPQEEEIFQEVAKSQAKTQSYAIDDHDLCKGNCE